jgi:peptide/nickel transport system substrate-binding protein
MHWPVGSRMARALKTLLLVAVAVVCGWWWWTHREAPPAGAADRATPIARGGELIASVRSDPPSYDRYVGNTAATDLVTLLTQARLVRVDRASDEIEPWLAERWSTSSDGLTSTLTLRHATFSDGVPFTADDVLFSFQAVYDERVQSVLKKSLEVGGQPLKVSAPDASTVVIQFPAPFAPGLRLLDNLPILPKHKLAAALAAGTLADEWTPARPLDTVAGLGPFILTEHVSGQRLVFERNPHYFRRDSQGVPLPYLDKLTVLIVGDQTTEALRLQAGEIDLMANGEIRPQDYAGFKRLESEGRLRLYQVGTSLDPDVLWFNLGPKGPPSPGRALLARKAFRQAISYGVDRQALADGVYLGAAVPIFGPVSPGNAKWYSADTPNRTHDVAKARALLDGLGLQDRDGDGMLETAAGSPVRFSMLSQAGHIRGRTASALQAQLRQLGIVVDLVALDPHGIVEHFQSGDYDSIYFGIQASSTDPALNLDFWLSSGEGHLWNPAQETPSEDWEKRIDGLMRVQSQAPDLATRQRAFAEVQRILGDELPAIYFVASRVSIATTPRVIDPTPALQLPQLLWSADTLASAPGTGRTR